MKRILFLTGTRADFGKLKPLILAVKASPHYDYGIFGTGMHTLAKYGSTINEIRRSGFRNLFTFLNQAPDESMEMILATTICGLSRFLCEHKYDLLVVHGDRVEALAGAIVGALRNVLVAHVEGGEISGTVDELIRHAVTKLSHAHFVANRIAEKRLRQLGEHPNSIFCIGSPDIDVMLSGSLPEIERVKRRYGITFESYAVAILHPVTTDVENMERNAAIFVEALVESGHNYVVIFPNNDLGASDIFRAYQRLEGVQDVKMLPSLRFEYFLSLLRHSEFVVGNSSCGIHEAPVYGVPTINIGTRQQNRFRHESILDVPFVRDQIVAAIRQVEGARRFKPTRHYGDGRSAARFVEALEAVFSLSRQKQFHEER